MVHVLNWNLKKLVLMIVRILENKFDCVIAIEGNRGLGKSTLAYEIARGIGYRFKQKNKGSGKPQDFKFVPHKCLLYTRKEVIKFFHSRRGTGIADEMINVTFNRDFYDTDQKDLIKMMNMNRDHCNLFISCVPQFQNLDNQVKNLVKIRITVVRRGIAVIQTPNRSIYSKDKWDTAINEKIERKWLEKGIQNPHYAKLTTFRGILRFPPLRARDEKIYQEVKDEKRNIIAREQMGITGEDEDKDPVQIAIERLKEGKIRNSAVLEGMAFAHNINPDNFKARISTALKKEGLDNRLTSYYWERKKSKGDVTPLVEEQENSQLISSIRKKLMSKRQK
jgi:hypothetical protein